MQIKRMFENETTIVRQNGIQNTVSEFYFVILVPQNFVQSYSLIDVS